MSKRKIPPGLTVKELRDMLAPYSEDALVCYRWDFDEVDAAGWNAVYGVAPITLCFCEEDAFPQAESTRGEWVTPPANDVSAELAIVVGKDREHVYSTNNRKRLWEDVTATTKIRNVARKLQS